MKLVFLGLGNMGLNLALQLQEKNQEVIAWNRSEDKRVKAREAGLMVKDSVAEAIQSLGNIERKVVFLMVSAGPAVDHVIFDEGKVVDNLGEGDVIIDGANSFYKDSKRRAEKLKQKGVTFLDVGISGGVEKARTGASLMIGGEREAFNYCEQLFAAMSEPDGYGYFGASGAGHYVKMVHNGIEYGMMQALAEGMNIIDNSEYNTDFTKLTQVWGKGSIIAGNLVKFLHQALIKDPKLASTNPEIGSLGTGRWTVEEALELGVPANAIAAAVFSRYGSRGMDEFLFKAVQAMRAEFGSHSSDERPST